MLALQPLTCAAGHTFLSKEGAGKHQCPKCPDVVEVHDAESVLKDLKQAWDACTLRGQLDAVLKDLAPEVYAKFFLALSFGQALMDQPPETAVSPDGDEEEE